MDKQKFAEELSKTGLELLKWVKDVAKSASDLAANETPKIVNELIKWGFWSNLVKVIIGVVFLILTPYLYNKGMKFAISSDDNKISSDLRMAHGINSVILFAACVILFFVGMCLLFGNLFDLIQVMTAPRVYLLNTMRDLIT